MGKDDPKARRMETTCWTADKSLRDDAFAALERGGFSPNKRPPDLNGWWGLDLIHNGEQTPLVSRYIFSVGYPHKMRHDPA
jgi:hypothetical protein